MAPRVKVTKEDIIKTTVELVRKYGSDSINARAIAGELECSTQPIFSNFNSMEELQEETILYAYGLYLDFIKKEIECGEYPQYKAFGMAYIRFAKEERELFKLLFMRDRTNEEISISPDFEDSVKLIMEANGLTHEIAMLIHLEMWTCVHGIGTMIATSFLLLEWELISQMISDVYHGIIAKHVKENK